MDPIIDNISESPAVLRFTMRNINVSYANAIRRVILSDIPTVVFKTFPYSENKVNITKNTTRLNNEITKQRISCIPIHITDTTFPIQDHVVELDVTNKSGAVRFVTTKDFRIKNIKNDRYLSEAATQKIFPPDPITKDRIIITRLRPQTSSGEGESIKLSAGLDISTAKENSSFNVACTCSFGASMDPITASSAWAEHEPTLIKSMSASEWEEQRDTAKQDWMLLQGRRFVLENSFDFIIESVGVFTNTNIVYRAADVMIKKLERFIRVIQETPDIINKAVTTIDNSYDIKLVGEDYTLGKAIEFTLYNKHYKSGLEQSDQSVTYCGFNKPHPHIDESLLRIGFEQPRDISEVTAVLVSAAQDTIQVFEKIGGQFNLDPET
tara:strand:- start:270 stop:1412 length:1143 start_codon:yes stop_codon:yes gene_type:complete